MEMSNPTGATRRLGEFVASCATRDIEAPVFEKAAVCLLDGLGLALIAREEPTSAAMRALAVPVNGAGTARIWADGTRTVVSDAVAANAVAVHAHFHDDTDYSSWTHPGSLIISTAVSLGEALDAQLERVLRGIVAGYGALVWLGADERVALSLIGRGIRTSPTLGTIGAAATAAAILGLEPNAAANAIGIASSITGGVLEPVRVGSDEWRVQNAHAARGGVLAAQLAERGVVGAASGLEGPKGLAKAMAGLDTVPECRSSTVSLGLWLNRGLRSGTTGRLRPPRNCCTTRESIRNGSSRSAFASGAIMPSTRERPIAGPSSIRRRRSRAPSSPRLLCSSVVSWNSASPKEGAKIL
jgi:2-methylcitrate dehydratase PrpD